MIAGILTTIYFFLPAGVANMAPVLVKKLNLFNYPIDCNAKLNNKPILGKNKTFRGLIFGTIFSIITIYLQFIISLTYPNLSIINYSNYNLIWLGFLLGFGALFGDICKSFFKRLNNIESGANSNSLINCNLDGFILVITYLALVSFNKAYNQYL